MGLNTTYLTKLGLLKVLEIICLIIAFSTLESEISAASISLRSGLLNYYLAITIIVFVLFVIWFVINCLGVVNNVNALILSTVHIVFGIAIVVPSGISAHSTTSLTPHTIKASYAFGIISSLIIFADAQFHHIVASTEPKSPPANPANVS